jgi:hypothetical protein
VIEVSTLTDEPLFAIDQRLAGHSVPEQAWAPSVLSCNQSSPDIRLTGSSLRSSARSNTFT